ncbi:MAG TPA: helix-turn-helix transcriptional regulator [Xanthobacteraceae bacterium]
MVKHADIWSGIDQLAKRSELSASGLARRAGLDPTTFNKSKRITKKGHERWPSTESIAKAIDAANITFHTFADLVDGDGAAKAQTVPLLGFAEADAQGFFDASGVPTGDGCDAIPFPDAKKEGYFARKVLGRSMEPAYHDGDVLILSRLAPLRAGDRIVLCLRGGECVVKEFNAETIKTIEVKSIDAGQAVATVQLADVKWYARVMWVRQ